MNSATDDSVIEYVRKSTYTQNKKRGGEGVFHTINNVRFTISKYQRFPSPPRLS